MGTMSLRTKIERAKVSAVVAECEAAGYVPVRVWDGGEYVKTTGVTGALDAVFAVDESTIHFAPRDKPNGWGGCGVLVILGNGEDCISDWHCGDEVFSAAVERGSTKELEVK